MARNRPSRAAARRSTPATPATPQIDSDDDMIDAPDSRAESPAAEEEGTPAQESEEEKAPSEPSSPVIEQLPRKKRGPGRPPKYPRPDNDDNSEGGTPARRKRGRPAGGGFRGRPRGGPAQPTRVAIDKEGTMMDVVDDEVALLEDAEGEEKVDKLGYLQGGREYRVRTFTISGRGERLYMLSTEPARCMGFRDSYLFFTKHMQLYKVIIDDTEKRDLITREIIPHSYKGRAIGVVTARSVFREFGARIIIGGKRIIDDYYVQAAKDRGDVEGEIAEPHDVLPPPGQEYNRNQYVAWHGASSVYHTGQPSVPLAQGKVAPGKKKVNITSANWQFEHGRSASRFNSALSAMRKANWTGIYDPHTNIMLRPKITQPTHARWEEVPPGESDVPEVVRRKYLVIDTYVQSPPIAGLGIPGPDGDYCDVGTNGLPWLVEDDLAQGTPKSRAAYIEAIEKKADWQSQWNSETIDCLRSKPKIGFSGVPAYGMEINDLTLVPSGLLQWSDTELEVSEAVLDG